MTDRFFVLLLLATTAAAWSNEPVRREPKEVARELLEVYGKKLDDVAYIPALAVYGRLRFAELTGESKYLDEVTRLVQPHLDKPPPAKSETELAGHLVFASLTFEQPQRQQFGKLVVTAVDTHCGGMVESLRPSPTVMSDSVFMRGPILGEAYRISDQEKYAAAARSYFAEMRKLRLRDDGLYRHGHLCEAAWGRGNGFPAVGVAWYLSRTMREDNDTQNAFVAHMAALLKHQDEAGMWHQVIDVQQSYPEFSCTCMIGFAMQRGISADFLNRDEYQPAVDKAWKAVCACIEPDGKLRGVCEGTGTQPTLEAYLNRKAIHGVDQRGGAMALLFATELMAAKR